MQNGDAMAMMSADHRADERGDGADRTKTIVPLVAALIPALAVPAVVVPAIARVLDCFHGRQASERGKGVAAAGADARLRAVGEKRRSKRQIRENTRSRVRHSSLSEKKRR